MAERHHQLRTGQGAGGIGHRGAGGPGEGADLAAEARDAVRFEGEGLDHAHAMHALRKVLGDVVIGEVGAAVERDQRG